jgi:xanthine dehydrogenase iron-sulfur cluster and FAD-binding subunit A
VRGTGVVRGTEDKLGESLMGEARYLAPTTLAEAVSAFADAGSAARILAGGTDLLVQMRAGVIRPETISRRSRK